jgi:hypothetical protein
MLAKYLDFETLFLNTNILTITTIAKPPHNNTQYNCCREMRLCVYNMIDEGRRGRKPGYIHEMGSHDLKSCEVKCQRNRPFANGTMPVVNFIWRFPICYGSGVLAHITCSRALAWTGKGGGERQNSVFMYNRTL